MSWTIKLVAGFLMTSLTGSIIYLVWHAVGQRLEAAGYLNILYRLMKVIIIFFMVPCLFWLMDYQEQNYAFYGGSLFLQTKALMIGNLILIVLWGFMAGRRLLKQIKEIRAIRKALRKRIPCEAGKKAVFEQICDDMKIRRGRVSLWQSYEIKVPIIWGMIRPMIVLPVEEYSEIELRVIFTHELVHYWHHDVIWKRLAAFLAALHCFNPVLSRLKEEFGKWSEYACDYTAGEITGGYKAYFAAIMGIRGSSETSYYAASLKEREDELVERVRKMNRQKQIKKRSLWKAMGICAAMVCSSSLTLFAASQGIAKTYEVLYDATDVAFEEPADPELIEYTEYGETPGITEELGESEYGTRSIRTMSWTVPNNVRKTSTEFYVESGKSIVVTVDVVPVDRTVSVGIIEPDGTRRYVNGKRSVYHLYELTQTGSYKVFVENKSGVTVEIQGSYAVE